MTVPRTQKNISIATGVLAFVCIALIPFALIYDFAHLQGAAVSPLDIFILYPIAWATTPFFVSRVLARKGVNEIAEIFRYSARVWLVLPAIIAASTLYWLLLPAS